MSVLQSLMEKVAPGIVIKDAIESTQSLNPMLDDLGSDMIELDYMAGTQFSPEAHDQTLAAQNRISSIHRNIENYAAAGIVELEMFTNRGNTESSMGQSATRIEV